MFQHQLWVMVRQQFLGFAMGYAGASLLFACRVSGGASARWWLKLPASIACMTWVALYQSNQKNQDYYFTQLVSQPAPHGNYVRNTIKVHFPYWWANVSKQLADNGMNLPEMNEYDLRVHMPDATTSFDTSRY